MQTTLTGSTSTQPAASSDSVLGNVLGGDPSELFTKLLVAQIKNQDPLQPSDPSQFVSQLTQLSQMESMQKLTSQNAGNATTLQSLQTIALGAQVGSQVSVLSDHVVLDGQPVQVGFTLQNASADVTLVLSGSNGQETRLAIGSLQPGATEWTINPASLGLAPGTYAVRVDASSKESPSIEVSGRLNSVRLMPSGETVINVTGVGAATPARITQFNGNHA